MRIAVLADVHANAPALRAVLEDLDRDRADAIVVAGDVTGGPQVMTTLELLRARPEPVHWVRGNAEREALEATDTGAGSNSAVWSAGELDSTWQATISSWPIALSLDGVCFCHGSPRRDDEILTRATPTPLLAEAIAGADTALVVGGHTHQQMIRPLETGPCYANAGSVGLPFEGRPGAFWMTVEDGTPQLRETPYDLTTARAELEATGFPGLGDFLEGSPFDLVDPRWVTALFEHTAGRGEHPGEMPRLTGP